MIANIKKCNKCGQIKLFSEFYKHKRSLGGIRAICKKCEIKISTEYAIKNKDKINKKRRERYKNKNEKILKRNKEYRNKNKEKINADKRSWYQINKDNVLKQCKEYRIGNKEKMSKRAKKYRANNKEAIRQRDKQYQLKNAIKINKQRALRREILKTDPKFILNKRISSLMRLSLKGNKNGYGWESLVEYTLNDLIKYLESLFQDKMSWENMGKWHIDHKIPISAFNFTSPFDIDFKRCWALDNLQPLWAKDNLSKGKKLIEYFQPSLAININKDRSKSCQL